MQGHDLRARQAAKGNEGPSAAAVSGPNSRRLEALSLALNSSPRVQMMSELGARASRPVANAVVQRVLKDSEGNPTEEAIATMTPARAAEVKAALADGTMIGSYDDIVALNARIGAAAAAATPASASSSASSGLSLEDYIASPAGQNKKKKIEKLLAIIPHLGGEKSGNVLTGGHLLIAMKAKWGSALRISGVPAAGAHWAGWWHVGKGKDGKLNGKWSSFFPAAWSEADLRERLWRSSSVGAKLDLGDGVSVAVSGDTFYPVGFQEGAAPPDESYLPAP